MYSHSSRRPRSHWLSALLTEVRLPEGTEPLLSSLLPGTERVLVFCQLNG